ncbi:MAG: ABC transporter ATP-binding protein [Deltaproteobacteria bacterium]|nr:ABC transporter ATP-binding protein [Deltaproteobacteria bacterium]
MKSNTSVSQPVLRVRNLKVDFPSSRGRVRILEGVNFSLYPGEILALVGETGCGKSVTAKSILNLLPRSGVHRHGEVFLDGCDLMKLSNAAMRPFRGRRIAMIFQNPQSSINPVFTLGEQIFRLIRMYLSDEIKAVQQRLNISGRAAVGQIAKERFEEVGLTDVERLLKSYAHQISGGMAQRYRIATALLSSPEVLIADEATSALDVTVQSHILKLLRSLCRRKGTSIVFITHDLGIAAQMCDRVAVMYSGRIVETAPTLSIFEAPRHPYTQGLLAAVPRLGSGKRLANIPGMIPDLANPPAGCRFHPRCPQVMACCKEEKPPQQDIDEQHQVACYLYGEHVPCLPTGHSRQPQGAIVE